MEENENKVCENCNGPLNEAGACEACAGGSNEAPAEGAEASEAQPETGEEEAAA